MVPLPPLRPSEYFAERAPGLSLGRAVVVVLLVTVVVTAAIAVLGNALAASTEGTVTETTMEPWPESQCESFEEMNTSHTPEPCGIDEPQTRERPVSDIVRGAMGEVLPVVFVAVPIAWLLTAVGLHVASAVAGGRGSFTDTLAVAAWGMVPTGASALAATTVLYWNLRHTTIRATSPEAFERQAEAFVAAQPDPLLTAINVLAVAWAAYVHFHGVRHARDLSRDGAAATAGVVAVVALVLTLT